MGQDPKLAVLFAFVGLASVQGFSIWGPVLDNVPQVDAEFKDLLPSLDPFDDPLSWQAVQDRISAGLADKDSSPENKAQEPAQDTKNQQNSQDETRTPGKGFTFGIRFHGLPKRLESEEHHESNVVILPMYERDNEDEDFKRTPEMPVFPKLIRPTSSLPFSFSETFLKKQDKSIEDHTDPDDKNGTKDTQPRMVINIKTINVNNDYGKGKPSLATAAHILTGKSSTPITFNIDVLNVGEKNTPENQDEPPCGETAVQIQDVNVPFGAEEPPVSTDEAVSDTRKRLRTLFEYGPEDADFGHEKRNDETTALPSNLGRLMLLIQKNAEKEPIFN